MNEKKANQIGNDSKNVVNRSSLNEAIRIFKLNTSLEDRLEASSNILENVVGKLSEDEIVEYWRATDKILNDDGKREQTKQAFIRNQGYTVVFK